MARGATIQVLRTTRANLNTQAAANNLKAGEPYLITDENRLAVGLTVSTYQAFSKELSAEIVAATAKTTVADSDLFGLLDSAASNVLKKLSWLNLKAAIATYVRTTLYVGTVVGSPPAGSIFMPGSTANGHYHLFADGTLICRNHGMSWSTNDTITFPSDFVDTNYSLMLSHSSAADRVLASHTKTTTSFKVRVQDAAAGFVSISGAAEYIAIGRWRAY